jgi:hypothetical protein
MKAKYCAAVTPRLVENIVGHYSVAPHALKNRAASRRGVSLLAIASRYGSVVET